MLRVILGKIKMVYIFLIIFSIKKLNFIKNLVGLLPPPPPSFYTPVQIALQVAKRLKTYDLRKLENIRQIGNLRFEQTKSLVSSLPLRT